MYENNLQYQSIEHFKGFKKLKIKKPKPISIKPVTNPIKKAIIKPVSSGTVNLGNTIGSGTVDLGKTIGSGTVDLGNTVGSGIVGSEPVVADDDYNEIDDDYNEIDDELLLDNNDGSISTTLIIIIVVVILLILLGLYFLI